ncbi:rho GTPase-activating protein 23 [Chanos chanos]|uniref:Rho GTPase-activating protein 23 n=1 Tax=Chanos chanos TaxID=29144 RepID=A0A6J2VH49_CHACN|nr:rho GTPase-activating protein 23-like [Chanos chanos]
MAQAKGQRDGTSLSNENARPASGEGVAWQGPRTVVLQKNSQGFGFTLRHFIVYPPESALHTSLKDEENGNGKGGQKSRLEPMDTIFVKNVRENGPAHLAGLCTGDRLVKVNGESVLGKTYSQVIALIQNSDNVLELSIMPKDEDVLQLAYSQDAYLRGNEPYTGKAQNLPEPPPACYPRSKPAQNHSQLDNLNCHSSPSGQAHQLDNRSGGDVGGTAGHRSDEGGVQHAATGRHVLGHHRARSSSSAGITVSPLDFHFANHNAAIASASLPHPRKGSLPQSRSELCHQALSDWYYSQAAAERPNLPMSPRHRSISQDRLVELGLALGGHQGAWPHSASQETLLLHYGAGMGAGRPSPHTDSSWLSRWGVPGGQTSSRSCSENLLAAYAAYEHSYGRSLETLDQAAALVSPRYERPAWPNQPAKAEERHGLANHRLGVPTTASPTGRGTSQMQKQQTGPQPQQGTYARRMPAQTMDDQTVGYRSYSPSFCRKAGHIMQQSHSFRDPSYTGPHLSWSPIPKTSPPDSIPSSGRESSPLTPDSQDAAKPGSAEEPVQVQTQEVVFRQKPPTGRRTPHAMRQPHYALPVDAAEPPPATEATGQAAHRPNGSMPPLPAEQDSLASIPFIDEPTSPSVDLRAQHVPASSVVSSGLCQAPALINRSVSPTLTSPLSQLLYTDCSNIKNNRRSSYLLAITTERSKSCDEGLNTFREEGRVFSRLPKRVKSFFTDGSLESLRVTEDARSKRHSTSELGTITLSDIRKDGWLHYKQILTEKGKKVGSGMRPWKRVFSVLRSQSLFLYKDKREAVLHGAGAGGHGHGNGQGEDEQPINIRGCLIDIAYSETKRKHTLRLTTQDFCEYLLQAEDREDMLNWIRVIRENSKTESEELGFSRQALINKKLNDYRKQSPAGGKPDTSPRVHRMMPPFLLSKTDNTSGVNRAPKIDGKDESSPKAPWGINIMKKGKKAGPKAFGVRLEDCPPGASNKFVPLIVEICCGMVEQLGLEYTGVYRVPGNNAMVSTLQDQLNKGMDINTAEEKWQDLNVISSLLKSFFRKLPEPLFTDDKYNDFIDANRLEDAGDRLKTMKKLIRDLPDHYYHTLKFVVGHLKTVADHSEKNKMEPRNLALVFGPTLVRTSQDNMTDMVTHMPDRYKIVETLILHHSWFFSDELDKDEKTPDDQQDLQPVPNIDHLLSNIGRTVPLEDTSDSTNSDSTRSKGSVNSKKDLNAKDFLPLSFISAVTRKRKKHQGACPQDSSTDEDSEHEPVKASNYGEMGGARVEEGEDGRDEGGCMPLRLERETEGDRNRRSEEVGPCEGTGTEGERGSAVPQREKCRADMDVNGGMLGWRSSGSVPSVVSDHPSMSMQTQAGERPEAGGKGSESGPPENTQPRRPRSFLYSHHKAQMAAVRAPLGSKPITKHGKNESEVLLSITLSNTPPSSSSTSSCFTSTLPSPGGTSQSSHRLAQGDPLNRKKLRGERIRPHSLYIELNRAGQEQVADLPIRSRSASQSIPEGMSKMRGSFTRGQERLHQTAGFSQANRDPSLYQGWVGQIQVSDDLERVGGLRRAGSPEIRRRRRDRRRHTVVVNLPGDG